MTKSFTFIVAMTFDPWELLASDNSLQYHLWKYHIKGFEIKGNHQLKKLSTVQQILHVSTLAIV